MIYRHQLSMGNSGSGSSITEDLNGTHQTIATLAPAVGTIPVEVSGQTRDDGDYHTIQFDDYVVVYKFPAVEVRRHSVNDGGFEQILLSAVDILEPSPRAGWLREYTLTATAPLITTPVDGIDAQVVEYDLPAPTIDGQRIDVVRQSSENQYLKGPLFNKATGSVEVGGVLNKDGRRIQLTAKDGYWLPST